MVGRTAARFALERQNPVGEDVDQSKLLFMSLISIQMTGAVELGF